MPVRNYSREALIQHCLDSTSSRAEAVSVLHRVVTNNLDFLVPYACTPTRYRDVTRTETLNTVGKYIRTKFSAEQWVTSYERQQCKRLTYHEAVARAFLFTPGLELPDEFWDRSHFDEVFRQEATAMLHAKIPQHHIDNLTIVRSNPMAGQIIDRVEHSYPKDAMRFLVLYNRLLDTLHHAIPYPNVVSKVLGDTARESYETILEEVRGTSDFDADYALSNGLRRQQRKESLWSAHDIERCMSRLALLSDNKHASRFEVGELYEKLCNQETARRNMQYSKQFEVARALGVWRIRQKDIPLWQEALTPEEWTAYEQCEATIISSLPPGTFGKIPRRHCNANSIREMKASNLPRLQLRLQEFA